MYRVLEVLYLQVPRYSLPSAEIFGERNGKLGVRLRRKSWVRDQW
jgi:hypothetical protein